MCAAAPGAPACFLLSLRGTCRRACRSWRRGFRSRVFISRSKKAKLIMCHTCTDTAEEEVCRATKHHRRGGKLPPTAGGAQVAHRGHFRGCRRRASQRWRAARRRIALRCARNPPAADYSAFPGLSQHVYWLLHADPAPCCPLRATATRRLASRRGAAARAHVWLRISAGRGALTPSDL